MPTLKQLKLKPTCLQWRDAEDTLLTLHEAGQDRNKIECIIQYHAPDDSAAHPAAGLQANHVKLGIPVSLKSTRSRGEVQSKLFMVIHPSSVLSLTCGTASFPDDRITPPTSDRPQLTLCLDCKLSESAEVIVRNDARVPLEGPRPRSCEILGAVQSMAAVKTFRMYV